MASADIYQLLPTSYQPNSDESVYIACLWNRMNLNVNIYDPKMKSGKFVYEKGSSDEFNIAQIINIIEINYGIGIQLATFLY